MINVLCLITKCQFELSDQILAGHFCAFRMVKPYLQHCSTRQTAGCAILRLRVQHPCMTSMSCYSAGTLQNFLWVVAVLVVEMHCA